MPESPATLLKKRLWFPVNFVKFLRTPFCKEHLWRLLLSYKQINCILGLTKFAYLYSFLLSICKIRPYQVYLLQILFFPTCNFKKNDSFINFKVWNMSDVSKDVEIVKCKFANKCYGSKLASTLYSFCGYFFTPTPLVTFGGSKERQT